MCQFTINVANLFETAEFCAIPHLTVIYLLLTEFHDSFHLFCIMDIIGPYFSNNLIINHLSVGTHPLFIRSFIHSFIHSFILILTTLSLHAFLSSPQRSTLVCMISLSHCLYTLTLCSSTSSSLSSPPLLPSSSSVVIGSALVLPEATNPTQTDQSQTREENHF